MRTVLALAALIVAAAPSAAQQRPSTTRMTCQAASALVARSRAIVLGTGGDTYDRFVVTEGYCATGTYGRPAFVPTRDNPQCNIGYYCSNTPPMFSR
jgi:hypothetical protein